MDEGGYLLLHPPMHQPCILFPGMSHPRPDHFVPIKRHLPFTVIIIHITVDVQDGLLIIGRPAAGVASKGSTTTFKRAIGVEGNPPVVLGVVLFGCILAILVHFVHGPFANKPFIQCSGGGAGNEKKHKGEV